MSPFIWGYVIFVVLVILGLNMLFRRGKASKNVTADDTPNRSRGRSRSSRRRQTDASDETLHEPIVNEAAELDETVKESAAPADEAVINESSVHSDEIEAPLVSKAATETNEEVEPSTERTSLEKEAVESYSLTNIEQKGVTETTEASEESTKSKKRRKNTKRSEIIDPRSVHPISIVAVLILGAFTAILNQTLLNVALPKIQTDLNVSYNTVQWLSTGYMLVNGVLIPITAFLLETFTTRVLFIFAMSSFGVGTIFCALSPTFSILLVGRLVQGIGAGIIMPLMTNVMLAIFPPEKRGAAMGTMGVAMIFAPAVGPTLSGWIIENYSWRLLFYVVLPIIIIDLILAFLFLRNVKKLTFPKLDFIGVILSTIGFGGILYGFSEAGNSGWGSARVEIALIGGIISLGLFVWRQLVIKNPILQFRVFQYNIFSLTSVVNAVITMAMFAGMILTPIYLQNIRGFTPLQSGLLLLPGAIVMGIMSPVTGILYDKIGARPLAVVGLFITIITTWMFAHLTDATTYGHIMVMYTFRMFGMSMLMMPIMTEGLNQLPPKLHSHGTAMSNTLRQVSGSLGTAFLVTVMTNRTTFHEGAYANSLSLSNHFASQQLQTLGQAISGMLHAPAAEGNAMLQELIYGQVAKESTIQGINDAFIVATILAVIAFVLSFFIKRAVKTNRKPKEPVTDKSNLPAVSPSNELATDQS